MKVAACAHGIVLFAEGWPLAARRYSLGNGRKFVWC